MSSWSEALPVFVAAAAVLFLPGGAVAAAGGARGYRLCALAAPLSFSLAGTSAIILEMARLPFNVWTFAAVSALVVAVTFGVRRGALRSRVSHAHPFDARRSAPKRPRSRAVHFAAAAGLLIAAGLIGSRLLIAIGGPREIAQLFDNVFHLNATAIIHHTGNGSSLTLGNLTEASAGFYPAAFHDIAAVVMGIGPGDVAAVLNAVSILLACVVWPISLTFLTTRLFGMRPDVLIFTGIVSGSLAAFPYRMLSFGVLYPFLAGLAMLPILVALLVEMFGRSHASRTPLLGVLVALAGITPGIALTHPSVLIAGAIFGTPFAVDLLLRHRRPSPARTGPIAVGSAYLVAATVVFIFVRPTLDTAPWEPGQDYRQAIGSIATVSPGIGAIAWAMAALLAFGLAASARRPKRLWPIVAMFGIAAIVYFCAAAVTSPSLRDLASGVWYRDTERVGALLAVAAAPLLVAGAIAATKVLRRHVTSHIGPISVQRSLAIAVVAAFLLVASLFGPLPQAQEWIRQSFGHDGKALLSDDERSLMSHVRELVPENGVVVGDPLTGASLTPAFAGRAAIAPHVFGARTPAEAYLLQHWEDAGIDPEVCPLISELNAYWAIDFGSNGVYRGQISELPGTEDLAARAGRPGSGSAITEIARVGDAALYEATACLSGG